MDFDAFASAQMRDGIEAHAEVFRSTMTAAWKVEGHSYMDTNAIPHPPIVLQSQWLIDRKALLLHEKELTRQRDRVNAERRRLPMVKIEKDYIFHGPNGEESLRALFAGRRQMIAYHFMFDPAWDKGWSIPWYSSFGSDFNYDFHVTLDPAVAPVEYDYRDAAGLEATRDPNPKRGEGHGLSVFFRLNDEVFHSYSAYARGNEGLTDAYMLLDLTPYGRQQDFEDSPPGWPQKPTYG
jgi:predicted dithiol-disulfide oxidoreductase (DUF899 family)